MTGLKTTHHARTIGWKAEAGLVLMTPHSIQEMAARMRARLAALSKGMASRAAEATTTAVRHFLYRQ